MSANRFDAGYFAANYGNYAAQNPQRKLQFYRQLIESARGTTAPGTVLDVGCAFGAFLSAMPEWRCFGADLSRHALGEARRTLPALRLCQGTADALPLAGPFDAVVALDTLEHVSALDAAGDEIRRVLGAAGVFLLVVPVYDGVTGPLIHLLDRDPTHVHKRSRSFWLEWTAQRFAVQAWYGIYRYLLPGGCYLHVPTQRLRRHTPAIAIVARRR